MPSTLDFHERFPDEETCRDYLVAKRWAGGFVCRACGSRRGGEPHRRRAVVQCRDCHHQTSATAGTVMHGSRLPLLRWFETAHLVLSRPEGISTIELQRVMGLTTHTPAFNALHRFRRAMAEAITDRLLGGVEMDDVEIRTRPHGGDVSRAIVGIAAECDGHGVRMRVLRSLVGREVLAFSRAAIPAGSEVYTPRAEPYKILRRHGYQQKARVAATGPAATVGRELRTWMYATHRLVSAKYLQSYLDEFVFRREYRGEPDRAFDILLGLERAA